LVGPAHYAPCIPFGDSETLARNKPYGIVSGWCANCDGSIAGAIYFGATRIGGDLAIQAAASATPLLPMVQMLRGRAGASKPRQPGQQSTIRTRFLAMSLDHETAEMQGEVVEGDFAGRPLVSMSLEELLRLLSECGADGDSVQLLQAYLAHAHPDWEESAGTSKRAESGSYEEMNRAHALEVLGLEEGAERADIVAAHRDLMRKLHPTAGVMTTLLRR